VIEELIQTPCQIVRRQPSDVTDIYGNELPAEELVDAVCAIQAAQQRQASEPGGAGEVASDQYTGFFLPTVDGLLDTADAVVADELVYELVGAPNRVIDLETQELSHIELALRRTAGAEDAS
jgi:hypothetical protein